VCVFFGDIFVCLRVLLKNFSPLAPLCPWLVPAGSRILCSNKAAPSQGGALMVEEGRRMRVAIVTDTNSGISVAEGRELGVFVLPMPLLVDGQIRYEGVDLTPEEFYEAQQAGRDVSTSQPSPGDVMDLWDRVLAEYDALVENIYRNFDDASRLADMSEELNGQSGQLHQASVEQNESTEALVQEVTNVKDQLGYVSQSSDQTRTKTEEIARCVQEANNRMDSLSDAMNNISANAQEITKIAKAIEDIAFQTSILAINASVEASRAGTAGKGFAVVADEVKQLASKSSEAAKSATDMVGSTKDMIQKGVEMTADTAGSLRDISDVSSQISAITDQLVNAVHGQEGALIIMEERIGQISAIADRNLRSAIGTKNSSGMLEKEAEALKAQVNKFSLKGGGGR